MTKTRYSVPPFGVDVFTGNLAGLLMAEVEFENVEEEDFQVPSDGVAEVTADPRFSGGRLPITNRDELVSLLAEFDIEPLDASELAARALTAPAKTRRLGNQTPNHMSLCPEHLAETVELGPILTQDLAARLGAKRGHGVVHVFEGFGPKRGRMRKVGLKEDVVFADLVDQLLEMPAPVLEPHGGEPVRLEIV